MTNHATTAAIQSCSDETTDDTPSNCAGWFELLLCEAEVEVGFDDEPDTAALGVKVVWETLVNGGHNGSGSRNPRGNLTRQ